MEAAPPAAAPFHQRTRRNSRSRRSHTSFSDLRLAPLSVPEAKKTAERLRSRSPGHIDSSTAHAYRTNHASYLAGRSAPSTPGILSRSPSRRRQYGGLSRKTPSHDGDQDEDAENVDPGYFGYHAVQTASHGGVPDQSAGYIDDKFKSKSESGLYNAGAGAKGKAKTGHPKTAQAQRNSADPRSKRRSHHGGITPTPGTRGHGEKSQNNRDDWLLHATSFTTSLLAEGKGQSWVSSQSSTSNLHSYTSHGYQPSNNLSAYHTSSDSDFDDALAASTATLKPRDKTKRASARMSLNLGGLPYDDAEASLRSPGLSSGWGSRFGSRTASRSNSRRGSRVIIAKALSGLSTPHDSSSAAYRFGAVAPMARANGDAAADEEDDEQDATTPKVIPDFVDPSARAEIQASLASVARQQRLREAAQHDEGYFGGATRRSLDDNVDGDGNDSSSDEAEVARLAHTPGFGLGGFGILDRLVGLGNFSLDENETEDDSADAAGGLGGGDEPTPGAGADGSKPLPPSRKARGAMPQFAWSSKRGETRPNNGEDQAGGGGGGGWKDAAWLFSVASKVLL